MNQNIEGILLKKTPYKSNDCIGHLLLRSGEKVSVIFYGGLGGTKKRANCQLELGHLIEVELKSHTHGDMLVASSWGIKWAPEFIRDDHRAFYGMCTMLEISSKISVDGDNWDQGTFNALANGLFYINDMCQKKKLDVHKLLTIFLCKLMGEQGIYPAPESNLFQFWRKFVQISFKDYDTLDSIGTSDFSSFFKYFCEQYGFNERDFMSINFIS